MHFTLSNDQRKYLGLSPVLEHWDCVEFAGDAYRPRSWLYFNNDVIMRQVISTGKEYREYQYAEKTKDRILLLPKTKRGKAKKLTASVLETRVPQGIYFAFSEERVTIASFRTQTTFYSEKNIGLSLESWLNKYISESSPRYLNELVAFTKAKRKRFTYKAGDFFAFKLDRTMYGFGRVLVDISKLREEARLSASHGLFYLMGKPVLVKVYCFKSASLSVDLEDIKTSPSFPSEYIFDNKLFYGEYLIMGNDDLLDDELDFPISYGLDKAAESNKVILQWGIIHEAVSKNRFSKFLTADNNPIFSESPDQYDLSPYLKDSLGFNLSVNVEVINACIDAGSFDVYWNEGVFSRSFDLRNPVNLEIRNEILNRFGFDPMASYLENLDRGARRGWRRWFGFY